MLLVGRQEGHPACKKTVVGCWRGYLSGARCRLAYGPADATATHCLLLQKNPVKSLVFAFLVPAHPVSPGKRAIKRMSACVCVCVDNHPAVVENLVADSVDAKKLLRILGVHTAPAYSHWCPCPVGLSLETNATN